MPADRWRERLAGTRGQACLGLAVVPA